MTDKHLIGKQILELQVSSSDKIYAMQQRMSDLLWNDLLPELNNLFDRVVSNNEVICINKIELDIGRIGLSADNSISEIVNKIINLLEEKIKEQIHNYSLEKKDSEVKSKDYFNDESELKKDSHYNEKEKILKKYLKEKSNTNHKNHYEEQKLNRKSHQLLRRYYFELWLHWLEKGILPSYSIEPEENWMELVLETLALDIDAVVLLENKIKQSPVVLQRLILQHRLKDLKSIVELYTAISQIQLLDFFSELKQLFKEKSIHSSLMHYRAFEINAWEIILKKVILERKKLDSIALGIQVVKHPFVNTFRNKLIKKSNQIKSAYPFLQDVFKTADLITSKDETIELKVVKMYLTSRDNIKDVKEIQDDLQIDSPQFFRNAGVVLIHPFLNSFFKNLNLLEENRFKDFKSQSKAVILLHYLATGENNPLEYEMVLPKFLCEMPANIPIDHTLSITDEEKEEANNLLVAVLEHWGALGSTTPDGLREGFLSREGKLDHEPTGWKLYVEHKTLDILLDRLPWNLSLIKLPWMKEILKVEWR
ncbi:contractile injection system tape measure protein [uncultured Psychroserpens sp.]|uniref:contractile injection system tape measure protein n=1 Tax=uncultured Psychroserpens sp. TaxID=255436 RepID=UPI002626D820|nr:contractile injection system tape measure protein [uncultured Psychroserpens sp.]